MIIINISSIIIISSSSDGSHRSRNINNNIQLEAGTW